MLRVAFSTSNLESLKKLKKLKVWQKNNWKKTVATNGDSAGSKSKMPPTRKSTLKYIEEGAEHSGASEKDAEHSEANSEDYDFIDDTPVESEVAPRPVCRKR